MVPTLILPLPAILPPTHWRFGRVQRQNDLITDSSTHVASDVYRELMRYVCFCKNTGLDNA